MSSQTMDRAPVVKTPSPGQTDLSLTAKMERQYEVEQFYYHEAALLDDRRNREWFELFTKDIRYFMPIRRTKSSDQLDREFTRPGDIAYFDDDHDMLSVRIAKLETGFSWAEDPPSRTRHFVTNVVISNDDGVELNVASNFHLYRTRLNSEEESWIGQRKDLLRRVDGKFMIARRTIYLEQTILLSRNLSSFF